MVSFITTGRDDDYGKNFLHRLYTSVSKNIEAIERFNIPYEYVIVEWSPDPTRYLIDNSVLKDLFVSKNVIDVVVKSEVSIKEGLNSKVFYEFFAKNVGIRMSKYDTVIILNTDIVIPESTMKIIVDLIIKGLGRHFYRLLNRVQVDDNLSRIKSVYIKDPKSVDAVICGCWAGDFLVVDREKLIEIGGGYDETNPKHRTISQSGMDSEILWNLHFQGFSLVPLEGEYWHINHGKPNPPDYAYNMNGYVNKSNWGFIDYPKTVISEKLIEIG